MLDFDITALGEVLVDFTPAGTLDQGNRLFESNPGGAPANVLAAAAKLGKKTAFLSKVGNDPFGAFLTETLKHCGIDTQGVIASQEANTTLAFVHLDEAGDRSFSFYRKPGADMMLRSDEVDGERIRRSKIFHFGSISMTHEPSRTATIDALALAKSGGSLITFDPNLRRSLWDDLSQARASMIEGLSTADVVKLSEEELEFIVGTKELERGSQYIADTYGVKLILITLGEKGCYYRFGPDSGEVPGFRVSTVDTTGAGDAFFGGMLVQLLEKDGRLEQISVTEMERMVAFANAAGALATTKKGAIPAMPDMDDIRKVLGTR
ncbi:carbohydrate kinase [Paenibacillus sp.]|uniref:carbohydrate kinase family protein n=1 Tax=Paenibacillus sp. TaxID=58172 RepID=UPI002812150F|nr:carbohydrate kinase [Paenibacillus sp.]